MPKHPIAPWLPSATIVQKQAFILAFSDTFYLLGAALIVALIAALLLKKPGQLESGGAH